MRGKTGLGRHTKTNTVRFAFHITRKIELVLRPNRLPADDHGVGRVGALAGCQHAQNHGPQQPRCLLALARHHARNVALRHMAEFMRQD